MQQENIRWWRVASRTAHVLAGFFLALVLLGAIGQVNFGKDAPAWVQAIGSIVGIAVAILIPLQIQRNEQRQKERDGVLRTRAYAIAFQPLIESFRSNIACSIRDASDFEHPDGPLLEEAEKHARVPEALVRRASELHEIGRPASGVIRAIALVARARSMLSYASVYRQQDGQDFSEGGPIDMEAPENYLEFLIEARVEVEQSLNQIIYLIDY